MAIYTAILPNGQPYQIQGPEGASAEDIQAAGLQLYTQRNPAPFVDSGERDYSLGTAGSKAVSRGMERVKSTFGDVIPAMVGNVFGADEYVKRQMYEAEASEELINRKYRAELQSYKDVQGLGDAIKFGVETIGEQIANLGVMALPGAGLGQVARVGAAKLTAGQFAKKQAIAEGIGVYLGSYSLNAPEVFQNIYQETGELATGTSLLFGAAAASLDAILPAAIVKNLTPLQKLGIAKAVLKKSGTRPGLVESVFKGLAKGASVEGVTEGMQEAISISAENFVGDNPQIFESEDWDRIMEASVRGAVAGGGFRGISSPFERPAAEPKPLTRAELENQRLADEENQRLIQAEADAKASDVGAVIPPEVEVPGPEVEAGPETPAGPEVEVPGPEVEVPGPAAPAETPGPVTTGPPKDEGPITTQVPRTPDQMKELRDKKRGELGIKEEDMTYLEKTNDPNYEGSDIEKGDKFRVVEEITPPEGQQGDILERLYTWNSNTFEWENKIPVDEVERIKAKAKGQKDLKLKILNLNEEESLVDKNGVKIALPRSVAYNPKGKPKKTYNQLAQDSSGNLYGYWVDIRKGGWHRIEGLRNVKGEVITPADIQKDDKGNVVKKKNKSGWWGSVNLRDDITPEQAAEDAGYQYLPETNQAYDPETDETFNWVPVTGNRGRGVWGGVIPGKPKAAPKSEPKAGGVGPKAAPKAAPKAEATTTPGAVDPKTPVAKAWASFIPDTPFAKLGKEIKDVVRDAVEDGYFNEKLATELFMRDRANKKSADVKKKIPQEKREIKTKDGRIITKSDYAGTPADVSGRELSPKERLSAKEFLAELKEAFGNGVERMVKSGRLYIADTVEDVPERFAGSGGVAPGTIAYFMHHPKKDKMLDGVILVIASRIKKGDARKILLHEIGEHYGLEVLLGKNYMPTLLQLNKLKNTDPVVKNAWASVLGRYVFPGSGIREGDKTFLFEVAARIGESAPENTWWKKIVARVKNALRRLGFYDPEKITSADIQDLIINSLDRAIAEPGPTEKMEVGPGTIIQEAKSEANQDQMAVYGKELDKGKTVKEILGPNIGGYDPTYSEKTMELAGGAVKAIQVGTPKVVENIRDALSNLPAFLREAYQGLLGLPAMISLYGKFLPSLKKLQTLLEIRAGTAMRERDYINLMGFMGMNAVKGERRKEFKIFKVDKEGNKGKEITLEDFTGTGTQSARINSHYVVELTPRTTVTTQYTKKEIKNWNRIVYEMSTTTTAEHPFGIDPTDPANQNNSLVEEFKKTPEELQLIAILYSSQFNQFANHFNANILKLLPDTTKEGTPLTPSEKKDLFRTQLINNQLLFYHPLKRKGPWRIEYVPQGETQLYVERVQTKREMEQRLIELRAEYASSIESGWVPEVSRRDDTPPAGFFNDIIQELEEGLAPRKPVLGEDGNPEVDAMGNPTGRTERDESKEMSADHKKMIDEIYGFYLDLFPSNAVKQSVRGREGIPGYTSDVVGGFVDIGARMANQVTNMEYIPQFSAAVADIRAESMDTGAKMIQTDPTLTTRQKETQLMLIRAAANDIGSKATTFMNNPVAGPIAGTLSYLSFMTTIAGNVSSALVNLTQVILIVIPGLIAKHGPVKGMRAFNDALKLYMSGGWDNNKGFAPDITYAMKDGVRRSQENADKGLIKQDEVVSQELLDLYDYGVQHSVFKRGLGYELTEMRKKTSDDFTGNRAKVEGILGWMFQNTERFNREVTFTASFMADRNMTRNKDGKFSVGTGGKTIEQAREEAQDFTREAHGTALPEVGPRYFQSGWGKTMFTFKRYGHAMLSLIAKLFYQSMKGNEQARSDLATEIAKLGTDPANKEQVDTLYKEIENLKEIKNVARKQLLGIYGLSFTVAGLQGMPLYGATNVLAEMINALLDDEDDEFFDFDESVRDMFGDLGYKGPLNKLLNLDIASRTGFSNLIFRDDHRRLGEVGLPTYMLEMSLGPSFSYALSLSRAAKDFDQGNIQRGIEQTLPAFLRNPAKAIRYANEGARNRSGAVLTELNGFDAFMQVFGFTNEDLSLTYERNNTMKRAERKILERRTGLLTAAYLAKSSGDRDLYDDILEKIDKFNKSEGGKRNPITRQVIDSSYKGKERSVEESMNGVSISKKYRDYLRKEMGGG